MIEGSWEGFNVGIVEGNCVDGATEGLVLGSNDGSIDGDWVGNIEGIWEGFRVGAIEGDCVDGATDGLVFGTNVYSNNGTWLGNI